MTGTKVRWQHRLAARRRDERGTALVEFALIAFLLGTIIFGIVEYGLVLKDKTSVVASTRTGARVASAMGRGGAATPSDATQSAWTYARTTATAVATTLVALPSDQPQWLWIYKSDAAGLPDTTDKKFHPGTTGDLCNVCVIYQWNVAGKKWSLLAGHDNWPSTDQNACATGATNPSGPDQVGVWVQANHQAVTGFFFANYTMTEHTVMRFEPVPTSGGLSCKP